MMLDRIRRRFYQAYERLLERRSIKSPDHVAIIQDGNRRYARAKGKDTPDGHRAGADTTERVLDWCANLGVEELTVYAFSTENFDRPDKELEPLFDLLEKKLYEFADADRVHNEGVHIRAIGEISRLPERVQRAVHYAERQTATYDKFCLNIALAYGGRNELLRVSRELVNEVEGGELSPDDIDVTEVTNRLYNGELRDVDLIIRTGGDERTSNFLPWHANGNEAAVYFSTPYWPEFSRVDLLRAFRTFEAREESWRRSKTKRAIALLKAIMDTERTDTQQVISRLREKIHNSEDDQTETSLDDFELPLGD